MRETLRVVRCQASLGGRSDGRPRSCERLTFVIWRVLPVLRLRRARRLVWDVSRRKASSGQLNEGCETAPVMRATSVPSAQRMTLMPFPSTNATGPVEGEAERGRQRPGEGKRAGARHPERGDRLVREEAGPEPGSVSRRPDRQRKLEAPRLRHLAARLRKRQAQEPRLTARGEERER